MVRLENGWDERVASFPWPGNNKPKLFFHLEMAHWVEDDTGPAVPLSVDFPEHTVVPGQSRLN